MQYSSCSKTPRKDREDSLSCLKSEPKWRKKTIPYFMKHFCIRLLCEHTKRVIYIKYKAFGLTGNRKSILFIKTLKYICHFGPQRASHNNPVKLSLHIISLKLNSTDMVANLIKSTKKVSEIRREKYNYDTEHQHIYL